MTQRLLGALAGLLLAGCSVAEAEARPPVWTVRDADSELVIFGSVHVLPPGLDWRPAELDAALAKADDLWFELPIDPASEAKVGQLAAAHGLLPQGQSLSALLSPEGRERLKTATADLGVSMAVLDRLEPWFAEVVLAGAQFQKAGAYASSGVEKMISGSAPAYLYAFLEALEDAGVAEGLTRAQASALARSTIVGAAALLEQSEGEPAELRRQVTSPGGTTEAALNVLLAENGFPSLMKRAVAAAVARAKELSK